MGSQYPPRSYDEQTLLALEQALRDVWQVLKAHDPYRDFELKKALAEKLMELRSRALESFEFGSLH